MNIVGNSSSNDFAHYFKFYIPRNVEKFHSYQGIAVAGLGGEIKKIFKRKYLNFTLPVWK